LACFLSGLELLVFAVGLLILAGHLAGGQLNDEW
jgi:hypothetical protein